jgi:hypothetical protein
MIAPRLSFAGPVDRPCRDATCGVAGNATGHFGITRVRCNAASAEMPPDAVFEANCNHDRVAATIETVISGFGLGMLG